MSSAITEAAPDADETVGGGRAGDVVEPLRGTSTVAGSGNIGLEMQYRTPDESDGDLVSIRHVQLLRLLQTIGQACDYDTPNRAQLGAAWSFMTAVLGRDRGVATAQEEREWRRLNSLPVIPGPEQRG